MRVGSLFSGIGGIDIGFEQAGFSIAWALEKDVAACKTYRANYPNVKLIENDIRNVDPKDLEKVDIITAGFPCQSFSIAGKQRGLSDPRGHLFYEIGRFIKEYKPRFVFLENVPNLMEHDEGKTFLIIHNVLSELDYSIRYRVLRASEYGNTPQIRDRIYIVAFREQSDCDRFVYPEKYPLDLNIETVLKRSERKHSVYYYDRNDIFGQKAFSIVNDRSSIYRVFNNDIKIINNHMCPTLTASMGAKKDQVPLVRDNYGVRKITIQECLDFQGFPKHFRFPHSITLDDAYKQIGNSVCVPVIKRIAEQIKKID